MKIKIFDWSRGLLLRGTVYEHQQEWEGDSKTAFTIAAEIFARGPNVMVCHSQESGVKIIRIDVDTQRFQQR